MPTKKELEQKLREKCNQERELCKALGLSPNQATYADAVARVNELFTANGRCKLSPGTMLDNTRRLRGIADNLGLNADKAILSQYLKAIDERVYAGMLFSSPTLRCAAPPAKSVESGFVPAPPEALGGSSEMWATKYIELLERIAKKSIDEEF